LIEPRPSRVLIRLPNWLGDALMARPLLHGLRRERPDTPLFAVAPASLLDLLAPESLFDDAAPWPPDAAGRKTCLERTQAWRAEEALVLPPSFSSAWFAYRSGARRRVGYAGEVRDGLLTDARHRRPRGERHLAEEYLELAGIGPEALDRAPALPPTDAGRAAAERLLLEMNLAGRRLTLLGPGALYGPAKRWGEARFVELGRRIVARGDAVAVCGTGAERDVCGRVADAIGSGARSLAGTTDLPTLVALCARAALAVCNDSGLGHLTAAAGTPTVSVFGSTSSAWTAPLGPRVRVVQDAPVCAPCFRRTCRIGYTCLERVAVERVEAACLEVAA
jgi:lipopolysaccharide heptosyltransferase II